MNQNELLSQAQRLKLEDLKSTYFLQYLLDVSLYHSCIIMIGIMASTFIMMVIIMTTMVECYQPLQRLKAFSRSQ